MLLQPEAQKRHVGHRHLQSTAKVETLLLELNCDIHFSSIPHAKSLAVGIKLECMLGIQLLAVGRNTELHYFSDSTAIL